MTFPAPATITPLMDHHDLTDRLRDLGEHPVPGHVRDQHLHRMRATSPSVPQRRFGRLAVAAAAVVGFVAGSTGLAVAGALPDPAQDVAHDVLATISVDVPEGTRGACVSAAAKDETLDPAQKKAAKDACPKGGRPADAGPPDGAGRSGQAPGHGPKVDKHAEDPCRGRPPWAGGRLTPEERAQRQADHAAARAAAGCPMEAEGAEAPEPEAEEPGG